MKNSYRALAVALAAAGCTAAFAQSSVTLYGRVNTTVERQKDGDTTRTVLQNNASRFGFKGVEDLGGGLKAGFQLESGFNSDNGASTSTSFFARQSEVNLSGNFGMVRLGRWTAESYFATADYVSMHNHDTGTSSDAFYTYLMNDSNKIGYRTPTMGGFWAEAAVSLHENQVTSLDGQKKNAVDFAANYELGGLALGAGYTKLGSSNQGALRALYSTGPFIFGGYIQQAKVNATSGGLTAEGKYNTVRLAAAYIMGPSEFHLNVGQIGDVKVNGEKIADTKATQFTLGYNYNLSKRTKVYGFYTKVNNSKNAYYYSSALGNDFSSLAVGIRHNF